MNKRAKLQIILIIIPLITFSIYPVYLYQNNKFTNDINEPVFVYAEIFRAYSGFVIILTTVILNLLNGKQLCKFIHNLNIFDNEIKKLGTSIQHEKVYMTIKYYIVITYTAVFLSTIYDVVSYSKTILSFVGCIYIILHIGFFLINVTVPVQFTCLLFILYNRFVNFILISIRKAVFFTQLSCRLINIFYLIID